MVDGTAALIATAIFIIIFLLISFQVLHETAAALMGAVVVFLITYIGGTYHPNLKILPFEEAMRIVDWNVIFLIMGMMIFMAILGETNIFKWLAFRLYQGAKGNAWVIAVSLILLTGFTSAFLNDVTAILLIVPLSIQIAAAIGQTTVVEHLQEQIPHQVVCLFELVEEDDRGRQIAANMA